MFQELEQVSYPPMPSKLKQKYSFSDVDFQAMVTAGFLQEVERVIEEHPEKGKIKGILITALGKQELQAEIQREQAARPPISPDIQRFQELKQKAKLETITESERVEALSLFLKF